MKKVILFFACLLLISRAYCQVLSDSSSKDNSTKAYYLQKSKNQKSGAWVLAVGGVVIFTVTGIIASHNLDFNGPVKSHYGFPIGLSIACEAGSIPLFIAARRNKMKAIRATTYFKMEKIPVLQQTRVNFHAYPAVWVKFNF